MVGTAHLIHNSVSELNRAINAAHTTLNNSINAFNALNFNKFLENVLDDPSQNPPEEEDESVNMLGDMRSEDEKLTMALEIAFNEISKDKNAEEGDDEDKKVKSQDKAL